ncbi:hypothetical protein ABZ297_40635 [Nonomuraea sp. NPDC005983]
MDDGSAGFDFADALYLGQALCMAIPNTTYEPGDPRAGGRA